jgi:hypothetical protein
LPDEIRHITVKRVNRIGSAGAVFGEDVKRILLAFRAIFKLAPLTASPFTLLRRQPI